MKASHPALSYELEVDEVTNHVLRRYSDGSVDQGTPTDAALAVLINEVQELKEQVAGGKTEPASTPHSPLPTPSSEPAPSESAPSLSSGDALSTNSFAKVNVNEADRQSLTDLPGIGPTSADRIISARETQPITDMDDLIQRAELKGPSFNRERLEKFVEF